MKKKTFVFDQVAKHHTTQDCWLIIHGKVYDVSPFMEDHPGGSEVLLAATGKDATADYEDIGHSDDATVLMDTYCIGEVDGSTIPLKRRHPVAPAVPHNKPYKTVLQLLLPLFIFGWAFALRSSSYAKN